MAFSKRLDSLLTEPIRYSQTIDLEKAKNKLLSNLTATPVDNSDVLDPLLLQELRETLDLVIIPFLGTLNSSQTTHTPSLDHALINQWLSHQPIYEVYQTCYHKIHQAEISQSQQDSKKTAAAAAGVFVDVTKSDFQLIIIKKIQRNNSKDIVCFGVICRWSDELRSDCEPSENLTPDDGNCEEEWEDSIFKNIDMRESSSNQPTTPIGLLSNLTSTIHKNSNLSKGSVNFTNKSGCPPCKTIAPAYRDLSSKFSTNNLSTRHSVNSNIKKTSRKPSREITFLVNPQPLQILDQSCYHPTASKDPVIQELASQGKAKVFTTDSILSLLMCATRSVYPWDIVIVKEGDKLFMDKQEGGHLVRIYPNPFKSHNAADPPMESDKPDSLNTPSALSLEVTFINQNFGLQVVKEDPDNAYQLDNPNPFYGPDETEPCASAGLRYQKFDLSLNKDGDLMLLIRAEEQTAVEEDSFITIRTLNKFNSNSHGSGGAPNWRAKLNSQCGAVVATEMKNNSCKLAKWAVQSILAGADQMNMG
ncbi:eukaryotic translation initiation factor 3 subunit 7-domain-containing protein [Phakopsora pachyrhizi]|nr:eukaryotic translation initiation factor 3 subunit 7-domain-containing protein [Phakopsora pachyrhizi]